MGNIIELCAQELYPDAKIFLGFTACLTRDYEDIPDRSLVEDCALEHGIDFQELNKCSSSDDGKGIDLLRNSVRRTSDVSIHSLLTSMRPTDSIYRLASQRAAPSGSITRFIVSMMTRNGRTAPTGQVLTI
jgi:hypothetical protein